MLELEIFIKNKRLVSTLGGSKKELKFLLEKARVEFKQIEEESID